MKNPMGFQQGEGGWTLLELMLVVAMIGIITPAITTLFMKLSQGMAADEMHIQMQALNEQTQLRLHEHLVAGRHLFQGDSSGVSFLALVNSSMSANTKTQYPALGGAKLAQAQPATVTGSFSPTSAVRADFGNSLLVAAYDYPQTFSNGNIYQAPLTVFGTGAGGASIIYGTGGAATMVIDLYRFYYYYLTTANDKTLRNVATYRLIEWESGQYADINEINDIGDGTLKQRVIKWLVAPPTGYAVTWAYDPTQTDPNQSFYQMTTGGTATLVATAPSLNEAQVTSLTHISSGILSTGFFYGISPNSAGWGSAPVTVPQFGTASGSFPGGFEVGISGNSSGREVLTRCLLVAQGSAPKIIWNDQTMVHNVRDLW